MSYADWFVGPQRDCQCGIPDGLADLSLIPEIEEVWVEFLNPPEQLGTAWRLAVESLSKDVRVYLFTETPASSLPPEAIGADPDGKLGHKLIRRPENLLEDMALLKTPGSPPKAIHRPNGRPR